MGKIAAPYWPEGELETMEPEILLSLFAAAFVAIGRDAGYVKPGRSPPESAYAAQKRKSANEIRVELLRRLHHV